MANGFRDIVQKLAQMERSNAAAFQRPIRSMGIALPPLPPGPASILASWMNATGTPSRDDLNGSNRGGSGGTTVI